MNVEQLKKVAQQGESERLEFKNSTSSLCSGMQTVCAFLNSNDGGTVIFGAKDDGRLIGQEVTNKTRKDIATELNKIDPYTKINVQYVPITERLQTIVFEIKPDNKAPYLYDGRAYTRNQATTIRMSKEEYQYLYNKNNPTTWETLTNNTCTLDDLDHNRIREVVRAGNL